MALTRTIKLGDIEVPRVGLGTNRLADTAANESFVEQAVGAGLRHIDTAHTYTQGQSEATIGEALGPETDGVVVATKGGWGSGRPEEIREQIAESLRRLRTDAIDLYYFHRPDPETPLEESLRPIKEARDAGKIRQVGLSSVSVDQIERGRRVVPVTAVQNHYNVEERKWDDAVDHCEREGIVFVPFFPLRGNRPEVDEIANRRGCSPAQVKLAWLLRRSPAILPIPGTLSIDHLRENLGALEIELSDAEFDALN
ncbi:MAG TPA: aldo/keto reductase [Gaiellaceae bacterium]|nr:aldo/keto reductase [Gaiellaceae bacterium]